MPLVYVLIVVIAVAFVVWRIARPPKAPTPRRDAPRGPDDDPEFLRKL
ncbi:hypothetical protein [Gordonia sp. (in: high G+C Gram-positive bacteria)]